MPPVVQSPAQTPRGYVMSVKCEKPLKELTKLCGAGSTVPREGFDSSVIMPFSWCVVAVTLPI